MINNLEDMIREFKKIEEMGWIKTHRSGPTGVGKTLEDLLGIKENNMQAPDFGEYELKSCRVGSNSMLTMFTKSPEPEKSNLYLLDKYGYISRENGVEEKMLHTTLSADRFTKIADTNHRLRIECENNAIYIESEDGIENVYWTREGLRRSFEKKYKNKFIYAKAEARGSGSDEEFHYIEAYEVSGFNYDGFVQLLELGKIYVDIRIGLYHSGPEVGKIHDHGTGFRIREIDQPYLFGRSAKIV